MNSGSNYTLECIISGEPEPTIVWFKDNVEIESMSEEVKSSYKISKFMNIRQLTINNADSDIHSGTYRCLATNEYGQAECGCGILIRSMKYLLA